MILIIILLAICWDTWADRIVEADREHYLGGCSAKLQPEGGKGADCGIATLNHRNGVTIWAHVGFLVMYGVATQGRLH